MEIIRKWKRVWIWAAVAILGAFLIGSCYAWGLSDILSGNCVFDTSAFDSGCVME